MNNYANHTQVSRVAKKHVKFESGFHFRTLFAASSLASRVAICVSLAGVTRGEDRGGAARLFQLTFRQVCAMSQLSFDCVTTPGVKLMNTD